MSRSSNENTGWQFPPTVLNKIVRTFDFEPEIDLFALYLNYQVENYISWFPDPNASIIDAFSIYWTNKNNYAFPPFSLIGTTLAKYETTKQVGSWTCRGGKPNFGSLWYWNRCKTYHFSYQATQSYWFCHRTNKRYTHYYQRWGCWLFDYQGNNPKQKNSRRDCKNYHRVVETCRNMKQSLKNGNSMDYQGMKVPLIHLQKVYCQSYLVCTLKAVCVVGCVELGVPYLVMYAGVFKGFRPSNDLKISERHF